jgi:hypothetical protein
VVGIVVGAVVPSIGKVEIRLSVLGTVVVVGGAVVVVVVGSVVVVVVGSVVVVGAVVVTVGACVVVEISVCGCTEAVMVLTPKREPPQTTIIARSMMTMLLFFAKPEKSNFICSPPI